MNIKVNIKSIVKYELFTGKCYYDMKEDDIESILKFLYCVVISNNDKKILYDDFLEIIKSEKLLKKMMNDLEDELKYIQQFNEVVKEDNNVEDDNEDIKKEKIFIKDIVGLLVANTSLSIDYIMNEMQLNEIKIYLDALDRKRKEDLENDRLWTFFNMLPHVDGSKLNSPDKLISFSWDKKIEEVEENITKDELENALKYADDLMNIINKK